MDNIALDGVTINDMGIIQCHWLMKGIKVTVAINAIHKKLSQQDLREYTEGIYNDEAASYSKPRQRLIRQIRRVLQKRGLD